MPSRTTIKIAEMLERTNIADTDLMIVEDDIDIHNIIKILQ